MGVDTGRCRYCLRPKLMSAVEVFVLSLLLSASFVASTAADSTTITGEDSYDTAGLQQDSKATNTGFMMAGTGITRLSKLGMHWEARDPFLFCAHHLDKYPLAKGNTFAPDPKHQRGRQMGSDFQSVDGWNMYHGDLVPGFPMHPHRGFETVTFLLGGYCDHSDSLGATARLGPGDCQWITTGRGIQHSEVFPLLVSEDDKEAVAGGANNTLELFQIWLNLPQKNKMVEPHFKMLWQKNIPRVEVSDPVDPSKKTRVLIIAGQLQGAKGDAPPPKSWAADDAHEVAIIHIAMDPGAMWKFPAASKGVNRNIYFFVGSKLHINEKLIPDSTGVEVDETVDLIIHNRGGSEAQLLVLQGRPIAEPVAQRGPFVMNTQQEIYEAITDYQKTQFGGWPWKTDGPHHGHATPFAVFPDGRKEAP